MACNRVTGPLQELLQEMNDPEPSVPFDQHLEDLQAPNQVDWDAMEDDFEGRLNPPPMMAAVAELAVDLGEWLSHGDEVASEDELEERSDESLPDDEPSEPAGKTLPQSICCHILTHHFDYSQAGIGTGLPRIRRRKEDVPENPEWFPWADREVC